MKTKPAANLSNNNKIEEESKGSSSSSGSEPTSTNSISITPSSIKKSVKPIASGAFKIKQNPTVSVSDEDFKAKEQTT